MATIWDDINYSNSPLSGFISKLNISDTNTFASSPAAVINLILPYILILSGLLVFFYLLMGAFKFLTAMGDESKITSGKKMITNALIGFVIIFTSYWLIQIIEVILSVNILTS
ncbi:MAG: hypothetical protein GXP43_02950 [bacterium]|nr:hypothetical protein [bacterium]